MKDPSEPQAVSGSAEAAHPELEELIAYSQERLDSTAAVRVREHLESCRECVGLVLDLEDFVQAEKSPATPEEVTEARLVARAVTWEVRAERWRNMGLVAASLFLATSVPLGIYLWSHGQRGSSEVAGMTPEVNLPLISLYPRSALRGGRENRLEVPPEARWIHLILTTDDLLRGTGYELVIEDAAGREVLTLAGLRPTTVGTFSIGLPASRVPPGSYGLHLFRQTNGRRTLVHEYPLKVVEGKGPRAMTHQGSG